MHRKTKFICLTCENEDIHSEEIVAENKTNAAIPTELSFSKYYHIMNDLYDELFEPPTEKKRNKGDRQSGKDFSTLKEMFVRALGLNIATGVKKRKHMVLKNNDYSGPANSKETNFENEVKNASGHNLNKVTYENKTYICAYCNKNFEDKGSIIFHLASHKFVISTRNAVVKPLSDNNTEEKKENGNDHRKQLRYDRSTKRNHSLTKVTKENIIGNCNSDNIASLKTNIIHGKDFEVSDDKKVMQVVHDTIEVTDKIKNSNNDGPKHHTEENFVLASGQTSPGKYCICHHCEKTFLEKGSLIFHLLAHKFINDTIMIINNNETKEEYQENEYIKITKENKVKDNITEDKINKKTDFNDRKFASKGRVLTKRGHTNVTDNITTQEHKQIESKQNIGAEVNYENVDKDIKTDIIYEEGNTSINNIKRTGVITRRMSAVINNQEKHDNISNNNSTSDNIFTCNECGRNLKSKLLLIAHIKEHCNKLDTKAKKRGITVKYTYNKLPKKACNIKSKTNAKEVKKFPLTKLAGFKAKQVIKKCTEKTYKYCSLCDYKTPYDSRLLRHNSKHTKSYECEHCKKLFRRSHDLKVHLRSHTGQKPFQCQCGVKFTKKDTLNRHLKTHTSKKSYKCTLCTSEFKLPHGLKRHLKIHGEKKFKCTSCESSFSDGSSLKRHLRCHEGMKPFSCDCCKYSTANRFDLKRHAKSCKGGGLTRQL